MNTIVAGNFSSKIDADGAVEALLGGGIAAGQICSFAINPAGQHGAYENEGEVDGSAGAPGTSEGTIKGAAIGSAIGLGAGVIGGPVGMAGGAVVGAYLGALAGALDNIGGETVNAEVALVKDESKAPRPAGVLVAIAVPMAEQRIFAADVLRQRGAREVEEMEGTWRDGQWIDFDPVRGSPPETQNQHSALSAAK